MFLKLKKYLFSKNHDREKEAGDFFSKTSSGLTSVMPLILTVFFTPALITTSLFSKEIIVMLANFSLSLGYITNFAYRLYRKEVSASELLISSLTLAAFLTVAYLLFPPLAPISFIGVLIALNQMAVAVNLFFLIKHVLVPPCKKLIEHVAQYMGFNITGRYYSKPPLTLEQDRHVIDQLLMKTYGHDSFAPQFHQNQLDRFNALLMKQSSYIDKYDESILGYINNRAPIADLEDQITKLTVQGNPESSFTFIRKKIGFKTTKIKMMEQAKEIVLNAIEHPEQDVSEALHFFKPVKNMDLQKDRDKILATGLKCLDLEILKQQEKINSMESCLPITR